MAAPQRTHYDVLGIARDADAGAVRTAWKLHVQAWHPDRFNGDMRDEAERQTSLINQAYTTLRDSSRRAAYDCRLASEDSAARPEPPQRRSSKVRPAVPRPASTPVGSPMAVAEPMTAGEQFGAMCSDAMSIIRRHPRILAAAVAVWAVVFGASAVMHLVSGPTLPSGAISASAAPVSAIVADDQQVADLEELASRARAEAAKADAEMEQMLREDAARAAAEEAAAARAAALAARRAAKVKGTPAAAAAARVAGARRIVRVMPKVG